MSDESTDTARIAALLNDLRTELFASEVTAGNVNRYVVSADLAQAIWHRIPAVLVEAGVGFVAQAKADGAKAVLDAVEKSALVSGGMVSVDPRVHAVAAARVAAARAAREDGA